MKILEELDKILKEFASVFHRESAFEWFVVVVVAFLLRTDPCGVTSFIRATGISPGEYHNLLHFFYSTAYSIKEVCMRWLQILLETAPIVKIKGCPVYVIDDIKVAKEGEKMPAVKLQKQESDNNSKPEYIMGHLWNAIGILAQFGTYLFCLPVTLKIHDGYCLSPLVKNSTIQKASCHVLSILNAPFYIIGDAFFTAKDFLANIISHGGHYIGRIRSSTVGYKPLEVQSQIRRRGRPRKKGERVNLKKFFNQPQLFKKISINSRKKTEDILYYSTNLLWYDLEHLVRFVLTIFPDGKESILISTDTSLSPEQIITAYQWRFRIESSFKALVHLICGFAYHFWLKSMDKIKRENKEQYLHRADDSYRTSFLRKIEAYERFVNIGAIALGILQLISLRFSSYIWNHFPLWLRTTNKYEPPSELVVRITLRYLLFKNFLKSKPRLLFSKIIGRKQSRKYTPSDFLISAA